MSKDIPARLKLESMLSNIEHFERDFALFEQELESYNFNPTEMNLQKVENRRTQIIDKYSLNGEIEFKALHLRYQVMLIEQQ